MPNDTSAGHVWGRALRYIFTGLIVFASAHACGDATGLGAISGTYTLQTVDGEPLPLFVGVGNQARDDPVHGPVLIETRFHIIDGSLRLNEDSTFAESRTLRTTEVMFSLVSGDSLDATVDIETRSESGTFAPTDTSLTLTYASGFLVAGSHSGDVITIARSGVAWVYER